MTTVRREATAGRTPMMVRWVLFFALGFFAASSQAQTTLTVFDDAMQNGFDGPNYSFGGGYLFNDTTQHHTGTTSISILGHNFNALAFAHVPGTVLTTLHTVDTPILRFWVNGGTASGQQFHFFLRNGAASVSASLDTYISGGSIAAGVWRQVTIDLRAAPFNAVDFDRFDIQSDQGAAGTDASATYFDDFVLGQPAGVTYEGEGYVMVRHPETKRVEEALEEIINNVRVELSR